MAFEALTVKRYWNASTNDLGLKAGKGINGDAYLVVAGGVVDLGQAGDWQAGDVAYFALDRWVRLPREFSPIVDARIFGVVGNGVPESPAGLQAAIDWAMVAPKTRQIYLVGSVVLTGDVTNLHAVTITGPGSIQLGTGEVWYVSANELNTGFTPLTKNTLYLNQDGDDDNSGLAPEYPLATLQAAFDALSVRSPLKGMYKIQMAEGAYAAGASLFEVEAKRGLPLMINGPAVDAWNNTTLPSIPVAITGITSANPPVVTAVAHGRSNGQKIFIGLAQDAGGMHDSDGRVYTVANQTANTFELSGVDGTGWAAYTTGGKVYDCNGNAPKAIIYGAGLTALDGIRIDGVNTVWVTDVHAIGVSTKATGPGVAGITAVDRANVRTSNYHATDCATGVLVRENSICFVPDGRFYNCYSAVMAIDARFTFGVANASTLTRTDTFVAQSCTVGMDVWESANGHADGGIFTDCTTEIWERRGTGHCVALFNRFVNTGADKTGLVSHGDYSVTTGSEWTGNYEPRARVYAHGSQLDSVNDVRLAWQHRRLPNNGTVTIAPAGGEQTILTEPIGRSQLNAAGQALRVKLMYVATATNSTLIWRFKLGADTLYTHTHAANASAREFTLEFVVHHTGFANVRGRVLTYELISPTTTPRLDLFTIGFDVSAAAKDFVVTADLAHASDTATLQIYEIESLGW